MHRRSKDSASEKPSLPYHGTSGAPRSAFPAFCSVNLVRQATVDEVKFNVGVRLEMNKKKELGIS